MTHESRRPRFARNAAANWIAFLFTALVGFFLSPYVVEHLGATRYGVWTLIGGLVGYLGLLDLGIRQAVNRYVSSHHAASEHESSSLVVSAALRLFGYLGVFALLLSLALAYFAPILFNIPGALVEDTRTIVVLGGATIALSLVNGVFGGVITGLERFDVHCALEILVTTIRTAAIVIALHQGYGLVMLATIQLLASVLNTVVLWVGVHRLYAQLRIRFTGALRPHIRTILAFGASLTVLYALGKIIAYSDALVIGAFLPIEAVTFFAIAGSLAAYAKEMPRALSYLMTPRVSALQTQGNDRMGELIVGVARVATLAAAPVAITFLLRGESFITLWMGATYGPLSGEVLRILAFVVWLDAARSVVFASLIGLARQRMVIPGMLVEAATNLALSLTLVHVLGILGVALGTLIPSVVIGLFYFPRCLKKATGVPAWHYVYRSLFLPTLACLPFAVATYLLEGYVPAGNLFAFFAQVLLILPLVPATAWILCISESEKQRVRRELARVLERLR